MTGKELTALLKENNIVKGDLVKHLKVSRPTLYRMEKSEIVDPEYEKKIRKFVKKSIKSEEKEATSGLSVIIDNVINDETIRDIKESRKKAGKKKVSGEASDIKEKSAKHDMNIELQFSGRSIPLSDIQKKAEPFKGEDGSLSLYINVDDRRVYYVNDKTAGSFEL